MRNFNHLRECLPYGKLLVFDDIQLDTKKKMAESFFIRGRHNRIGVIPCEQFTQDTAHIEKENTDYFVLVPPFSEYTAEHYHKTFIPDLSAKNIVKIRKTALLRSEVEKNPELAYSIINIFGQITIGFKYHVCQFEDGNKYAITKIKYGNAKIKPDVSINRH